MGSKRLPLSDTIRRATELGVPGMRLQSIEPAIDKHLNGGLLFGGISEWGLPAALGREAIIVKFIAAATQGVGLERPIHCLWVASSKADLMVYPPAWAARGVELRHIRFAVSAAPVSDLKPILLSSCFKVIVFDCPASLSSDDLAFVAAQARVHKVAVLILRPYILSDIRPCVWARPRVNCVAYNEEVRLQTIRGLPGSMEAGA